MSDADTPELDAPTQAIQEMWEREQLELKEQLDCTTERLGFAWPSDPDADATPTDDADALPPLRLIGGVDISFLKGSATYAVAVLSVLTYPEMETVHIEWDEVALEQPYIPGFLAFREVDFLLTLIERVRNEHPELVPQLIMVDGNGVLHRRGFGLASHLGVLAGIPTIGIGKTFYHVPGLTKSGVKERARALAPQEWFPLTDTDGVDRGAALRPCQGSQNPVFVSIGHRIDLETAVQITIATSRFRVPDPVRSADQEGRKIVREKTRATPPSQ